MKTSLFYKLFPPPVFLRMPSVGLDISDQNIRFLELEKGAGGLVVKRFAEQKIPPGIITGGHIKRREELHGLLSAFYEKHGISLVRVSLPEERVYTVIMEVPTLAPGELRESIMFQLEEYVPVPPNEAVFDYYVIGKSKGHDGYIEVLVSVLPEKEVADYVDIFKNTGITPIAFEIEGQAIARAVLTEGDKETTMIVDFGRTRTGISIVSEGMVRFSSTVEMGSDMITKDVEKHFGVFTEEAERIKNERGITKAGTDKDFFLAIMNTVSVLRDEINKVYVYWHTHLRGAHGEDKIARIVLSGGGANLNGLSEYLAASLRIKVSVGNPWQNVNSFDRYIPTIPRNEALGFSAVIGLALGDGSV